MNPKKIFILLPDGVGLRNFAFTSFVELGEKMGWEVMFWNQTPFDLTTLGYKEIKLNGKPRALTDLLKRAKINAELNHFEQKFNDPVYQTYKFYPGGKGLKTKIKNSIVSQLATTYRGETGLQKLRSKLKESERKSVFYQQCVEILQREQPDFIFCSNQRPVTAIAPLTAAQDLGISTGTFIFSWDNLPKGTMVVEADHYFVWSDYMKEELLTYYPHIKAEQVLVTGSPQFEPHFVESLRKSRETFFYENNLDTGKKYICFSGDDITTSPDDPQYLHDVAEAVQELNSQGKNLGIIFRRCPVDFSDRYDNVLEKFEEILVPIAPKWIKAGGNWNAVLPTKDDMELQINTILHSEAVINLGSSMVFDFAVFRKPCMYINYAAENKSQLDWSTTKIYNFVHFRSMPFRNEVYWLNSKSEISSKLKLALQNPLKKSTKALDWFKKINFQPASKVNHRIWDQISKI